jgi:PTS system nitrogen regulatory IIA component
MNFARCLKPSHVRLEMDVTDRAGVLAALLGSLAEAGAFPKERTAELLGLLLERESQASTGLENGVALPHARTDAVDRIQIAFGRSDRGVDFRAPNGEPARLIFLVLAPPKDAGEYLKALARIATIVKDKDGRRRLLRVRTAAEVCRLFDGTP